MASSFGGCGARAVSRKTPIYFILGNKTFDFSCKKKDSLPKNDQIWPKIGIFGHFGPGLAGSFGALVVGWLVAVTRGLYLARHQFTLYQSKSMARLVRKEKMVLCCLVCARKIKYIRFHGSPDDSHALYAFIYVRYVRCYACTHTNSRK